MKPTTVTQLNTLNREFYARFAGSFAASRARTEPGLERVLAEVHPGDRLLDLGCGHGRIARLVPGGTTYTGMDYAAEMLEIARQQAEAAGIPARFVVGDLLAETWSDAVAGPFAWVVLRAVLHHIPGYANRLNVIRRAARRLAPHGQIVMANWQFLEIERLRKRLLPWERIGLTEADVEPGDYLLDWQRDGYALRYVHLVDEAETARLARDAGLALRESFRADGHNNRLTLYAMMGTS